MQIMTRPNKNDFYIMTALPLIVGILILPTIEFPIKCFETFCKRVVHVDEFAILLSVIIITSFLIYCCIISPKLFDRSKI